MTAPARLTCGNGSPWGAAGCGPCPKCRAELRHGLERFRRAVLAGTYDDRGYTPHDLKACRGQRAFLFEDQ